MRLEISHGEEHNVFVGRRLEYINYKGTENADAHKDSSVRSYWSVVATQRPYN